MNMDFKKLMSSKSDEQLGDYLTNIGKYTEEAVMAAIQELQKRGKQFSEEELNEIKLKLEEKRKAENDETPKMSKNSWTKNVVTDPDAPALYSQRAIWGFSVFFTVIFGAVLLSSNLKAKGNARWQVIVFGVLYTGLAIVILSAIPRTNAGLTIGLNAAGAWIMNQSFWNKHIGAETKYRAKPIWVPLIVSMLIMVPFILALIYGEPGE